MTTRWTAEPYLEGGQTVGNDYELRESALPGMAELWMTIHGEPERLLYVRTKEELEDYIAERIARGWFRPR